MLNNQVLSNQNLEDFNYDETKKNVFNYFRYIEVLQWEFAKLNTQNGLTANYDFSVEYKNQSYMPIRQDEFNLSSRNYKEEELREYLSGYYLAKSILSDKEQIYIDECFVNRKYEDELVDILGFNSPKSRGFINLKRSAVYKFADFLGLVAEKDKVLTKGARR